MSIIERVAQLLEPAAQTEPRSFPPRKARASSELDIIERALKESNELAPVTETGERGMPPASARGTVEFAPWPSWAEEESKPSRNARTVAVDIERLRQRGMIAPGGERTATTESFQRIKRRILTDVRNPKPNRPANLVLVTS